MDKNRSLYEVLGVLPSAEIAEIRGAFTQQLASLENSAAAMGADEMARAKQMLRIAAGTLLDSSSRLTYDAKLTETGRLAGLQGDATPDASLPRTGGLALSLEPITPGIDESVKLRADALALRAESLSLRADAMLLQSGQRSLAREQADAGASSPSALLNVLSSGPLLRILMFLIVLAGVAFGVSRCASSAPMQANPASTKAMERAAIEDYFQAYGVRPANMAELERLETERRRRENEQRSEKQDSEQTKREQREQRREDDDARRDAQRVAAQLRADEERQQQELKMEQRQQDREAQQRKEAERIAEERRVKQLEEQWRQTLQRR